MHVSLTVCANIHCDLLCTGVTLHPENQTNATGHTIELACDVFGIDTDDDLVYQWIKSDPLDQSGWRSLMQPVVVNDSNVLPITNASVSDNGVYNCIVFSIDNNSTVVKSNSAIITILGMYVYYTVGMYVCMYATQ